MAIYTWNLESNLGTWHRYEFKTIIYPVFTYGSEPHRVPIGFYQGLSIFGKESLQAISKPEFSAIRSLADALVWSSIIISLSLGPMPGTLYCIIWAILRTEELR